MFFAGVLITEGTSVEKDLRMAQGETVAVGGYTFSFGEIVRVGLHQQANVPVYLVDFIEHRAVLGCLEEELVPL